VVDLVSDGHPSTYIIDVTDMTLLPDGMFGAAFVSHVLEHIPAIERALSELERVCGNVFVAYPRPQTIIAWLHPDHRHIIESAPPYGALKYETIR
jgi:ubiquinone/menaquinone biosynthesis C-methylase UbiE